eukprot:5170500-Prymnesium_polylepis.1
MTAVKAGGGRGTAAPWCSSSARCDLLYSYSFGCVAAQTVWGERSGAQSASAAGRQTRGQIGTLLPTRGAFKPSEFFWRGVMWYGKPTV